MISSERIDLTRNRDFNDNRGLVERLVFSNGQRLYEILNRTEMSYDEYLVLERFEFFFGRKTHNSEYLKVFSRSDETFAEERRWTCERCGKPIRVPWKNYYGLCKDCNDIVRMSLDGRIPWLGIPDGPNTPNDSREIFDLR